jgi:metal-dependent hydrolase (beta-lactamase superfamily II)
LADHERARKLQKKTEPRTGKGTAWGIGGTHKTPVTKVPLDQRVKDFPDQSFKVVDTPNGKVLFCRCCPKEVENILGTIKTHSGFLLFSTSTAV